MAKLDDIKAEVARESTVVAGVKTLIAGLSQQIADLKANGGATPEQLDEILAGLKANNDDLAAAVVANTPADQSGGQGQDTSSGASSQS